MPAYEGARQALAGGPTEARSLPHHRSVSQQGAKEDEKAYRTREIDEAYRLSAGAVTALSLPGLPMAHSFKIDTSSARGLWRLGLSGRMQQGQKR